MKKIFILGTLAAAILISVNCGPSKKVAATPDTPVVAKLTYEGNLQTLVAEHCTPCHIPAKGGNKRSYDNYANIKTDIDEIIRRISLNPGERGFMPFKHPKLSDTTIAIFRQWKADGMLER